MKPLIPFFFVAFVLFSCSNKKNTASTNRSTPVETIRPTVFDYQPRKPIKGELMAAIELGALGLNYFIIRVDNEKRWELVDVSYGRSNIIYGINTTGQIIENINAFRNEIIKTGVPKSNIHLLASSSAIKADVIEELSSKLETLGMKLSYIGAQEEARFALDATIPREFINESFLVDIGSGNTKLSWVSEDDTLSLEIHGSKYFLGDVQDTTVFREVRDALLEIPEKNRHLCFMLGGMIYEFVKDEINTKKQQRYFVLKEPNDYPSNNEKLRAGNIIYNALYLEPTYSYIFDSKSNFSIGYLLSLKK